MQTSMIDLLKIIACPQCKGDVTLAPDQSGLICNKCRLFYKIRDGIPIMLITEAQKLDNLQKNIQK